MSKRVTTIENVIRLCQYMRDRLKYLRPSVASLISQAASSEEFKNLEFLTVCDSKLQSGMGFPESWAGAVAEDAGALGREAAAIVSSLSEVLGAYDLESQLSALDYSVSALQSRLSDAREYAARHGRLYRTLGVLAGLGLAVFIA